MGSRSRHGRHRAAARIAARQTSSAELNLHRPHLQRRRRRSRSGLRDLRDDADPRGDALRAGSRNRGQRIKTPSAPANALLRARGRRPNQHAILLAESQGTGRADRLAQPDRSGAGGTRGDAGTVCGSGVDPGRSLCAWRHRQSSSAKIPGRAIRGLVRTVHRDDLDAAAEPLAQPSAGRPPRAPY